ncbi:hypothetical protein H107_05979, partial [Trichophyton rubrum CBS 202.88]
MPAPRSKSRRDEGSASHSHMRYYARANRLRDREFRPRSQKNKKGSATRELGTHDTSASSLWHCITPDHAAAGPVLHDVVQDQVVA